MARNRVTTVVMAGAWVCGAAACTPADSVSDGAGTLAIQNVTVVSPERAAPLEHATVVIRDGIIAEVTDRPVAAAEVIDGTGRFLVPGLIDSHVHLGAAPGMLPMHEQAHPALAAEARAQEPRSFLYFGFTTVIDLFAEQPRITEWNGTGLRPDAFFCGGAPVANGYPMVFTPEAVRFERTPYFLFDPRQRDRIPASVDPAAHTPEAVVERIAADQATCIKTAWETGFGAQRNLPTPTVEMVRALKAAGNRLDLPVVLHANSLRAQQFALEAGVDVIAHGLWNGYPADEGPLPTEVRQLLTTIADRGMAYQPTMQVLRGEVDVFDGGFLERPALAKVYAPALLDWYRSDEGQWFRADVAANLGGRDAAAAYAPILRQLDRVVAFLAEHNANLVFGSDTPSGPTYANPPGLNGRLEMQRWIEAGVSEAALFRALTLANARAFGLDETLGTVEPGRTAHLLLLGANPLADVSAWDAIETVILRGRPIARETLAVQAP